ncbi:hypothetical protein [Protaetiibacter larvae]|uniref:Uncharacterized protein n=1 Tax=Protaetiibacter larvae TaxID=2592654 RepID=A0A5C1Y6R7_9MICO|nr:hypothetical protein [Protaetiibacter larvae]QEO09486.1 hypothetical protein FLP23_05355 [Protaetiibacter larvae]
MPSASMLGALGLLGLVVISSLPTLLLDPSGDDGSSNLGVTVIDPSATASPQPSPNPSSGPSGPRGGGGDEPAPRPAEPAPDAEEPGPSWVVLSGLDNTVHGEVNPLRGWVHSVVSVANRSETETVSGTLTFRLRSTLGLQLGPALTRDVDRIEPGETVLSEVDLYGVGQWPMVQVSVTFEPDDADGQGPMTREAWVLTLPWLLLAGLVLAAAAAVILWLRRPQLVRPLRARSAT